MPETIVTPGVDVVSVAEIAVAPTTLFAFVRGTTSVAHSPGSTLPFPFPPTSVNAGVPGKKAA